MTEGLFYDKIWILQSLRHFLAKMPPPFTQGRLAVAVLIKSNFGGGGSKPPPYVIKT